MAPLHQDMSTSEGQSPVAHISIPTDFASLASICLFLTLLAVTLRVFTKVVDLRRMQSDDYVIIFAAVGFVVFTAVMFVAANAGLALSVAQLTSQQYKSAVLFSSALDIIYAPTMFAAKLAILVQLDRIFTQVRQQLVYSAVRFLIILNALCYIGIFVVEIINCQSNSKISGTTIPGLKGSRSFTAFTSGAINIISNVIILVMAIFGVAALQLSLRRQILLALMLAIGSFTCVSSVCRLVYDARVEGSSDYTATVWPVYLWTIGELTSIIFCACSPTFPRLLQYMRGQPAAPTPSLNKWAHIDDSRAGSAQSEYEIQPMRANTQPTAGKRYYAQPTDSSGITRTNSTTVPATKTPPRPHVPAPMTVYPIPEHCFEPPFPISPALTNNTTWPSPVSPNFPNASPTATDFSVAEVEHVRIKPVFFATIRKTVSVRVSSHTNPGSPMAWKKGGLGW